MIGNKGEWSEVYTFLKLLSVGKLYAADAELNIKEGIFYDIVKIFRTETIGNLEFNINLEENSIVVVRKDDNSKLVSVPMDIFKEEASLLLNTIKSAKVGAFESPQTKVFMKSIYCSKVKAPSDNKSDITIKIHDINTGFEPSLGFSIKSRLGNPSTLLNAGKSTNFTYRLTGNINDEMMQVFNSSDGKIKDKFDSVLSESVTIDFVSMDNMIFKNNLILIDSDLPKITAYLLLQHYVYRNSNLMVAIDNLKLINPCGYDVESSHPYYEYKIKKLITESALGMLPATPWLGKADATGGYIIVREDGEVLCYHLYNRNDFEDYLLGNTKFETASTTKYDFARIYKENDMYYIKLNLQIRFIK